MNHLEMLKTHPRKTMVDPKVLSDCIEECLACVDACNSCADACLGEQQIDMLRRCIRLNLDCADACQSAARMLARQTEPAWLLIRAQVQAMELACRLCAEECEKHAKKHEHCRICAEACRRCEAACRRIMSLLPAQA